MTKEIEFKLNEMFSDLYRMIDDIQMRQDTFDEELQNIKEKQNPMIVDLKYVVKDNDEFLDEPNHTVDVSKESENNLNNKPNHSLVKDWEEEPIFVRSVDVRLKNGETYIYDFDNIKDLYLCELEDDTTLIFEYIKTLEKDNKWIELRNTDFEYSLVRALDIAEVKVRYEEV